MRYAYDEVHKKGIGMQAISIPFLVYVENSSDHEKLPIHLLLPLEP